MSKKRSRDNYHNETKFIHGDFYSPHWNYKDHMTPPISSSAAFRLESAERGAEGFIQFANPDFDRHGKSPILIYERLDEPSRSMLEENLAVAEGGECAVAFTTGMAAITASILSFVKAGESIIAHPTLYGCTFSLFSLWLPRFGVNVKWVDLKDEKALEKSLDPTVRAVYTETPSNPILEIIDLGKVRKAIDRSKLKEKPLLIVDNTFATPFCQRPLSLGADVVVHSLTKNIGGFGTDMGGMWVGPKKLENVLLMFRKDFGAPLSAKSSWQPLVYGLPTLHIRMKRQMETAMKLASFLEKHPLVERVSFPGLKSHPQFDIAKRQMKDPDGGFAPGSMIYFVLKGKLEKAQKSGRLMMNHLAEHALALTLAVSLGNVRTLIEHPSSMTHAPLPLDAQVKAGIDPGGIRISVGLEKADDILRDLQEAFDCAKKGG
ncbi:MAG TPA: aminotransferase class I/II-fold pyridoxal phosphate-dependent enzyme [Acidobacteriota bacterium]|nr:aminotransferase class I/II-fold pyridoxal phosphate-dependent enzyme [Acidobacteriota bacterium]HNT17955.1 aminotransferase class I/II-fold pyridoxal phosphate-dependent enzyme [Acidobacteriota bacterium]